MCVICFKPAGVPMPDRTEIRAMAAANPHGFGFCTTTGKYFKTTSYRAFVASLAEVSDDEGCVMHFRYATHGSIKRGNCHPFAGGGVFFAHNGILPYPSVNDHTDSEYAFRNVFLPALCRHGLDSDEFAYVCDANRGVSRLAFMQGSRVRLFGDFCRAHGRYYSNMRWRFFEFGAHCSNEQ